MDAAQQIDFKSTIENISVVEKLVDEVFAKHNIHEDHYGNLLIALTEAVNNAIVHGNGGDPEKNIYVEYQSEGKWIEFKIQDEGNGFDFEHLPDPTDPKNIEKPNGRGVFLMKNLADEVNFHDEGRIVKLKFDILAN
ncbi:MAG: ATP-binding protein [Flavobacteriales bacterium]|nr:ATP-binding protein [Flavobacteriales bacterium]